MRIFVLCFAVCALSACSSLVKITPAGDNVAVVLANQVANCTPNGSVTVAVINKVVVNRKPEKVAQELRTLARNRAASRGDTIVATTPVKNGEQTYDVYQCRR